MQKSISAGVIDKHEHGVFGVCFGPKGRYMATASLDKTVRLWKVATGACVRTLSNHTDMVYGVAWSPNGKYLASGGEDRSVVIERHPLYSRSQEEKNYQSKMEHLSEEQQKSILKKDAKKDVWPKPKVKTLHRHGGWMVTVWKAATGEVVYDLKGHEDYVYGVAWSPSGNYIATGSDDCTLRVWKSKDATLLHTISAHGKQLRSVIWSPDSQHVASASKDKTVRMWRVKKKTYSEEKVLQHDSPILCVEYTHDGDYLATGCEDGSICIWDTSTHKLEKVFKEEHMEREIRGLAFAPSGHFLAAASTDGTVQIYHTPESQPALWTPFSFVSEKDFPLKVGDPVFLMEHSQAERPSVPATIVALLHEFPPMYAIKPDNTEAKQDVEPLKFPVEDCNEWATQEQLDDWVPKVQRLRSLQAKNRFYRRRSSLSSFGDSVYSQAPRPRRLCFSLSVGAGQQEEEEEWDELLEDEMEDINSAAAHASAAAAASAAHAAKDQKED